MKDEQFLERIVLNPEVMVGKFVIRETRLTIDQVLNLLAHGATEQQILEEYKGLTGEDFRACFLFASKALKNKDRMPLAAEPARCDSSWMNALYQRCPPGHGIRMMTCSLWDRLLSVAFDRASLEDTYDDWVRTAEKALSDIRQTGFKPVKVPIDVEELIDWCKEKGCPVDGSSPILLRTSRLTVIHTRPG
jgi:uncharacterized protein (DUF433 family)